MTKLVKNLPNAGKLIHSLRNVGYDNAAAIADIIDNSFDAGAKNVDISLLTKDQKVHTIVITDDGSGMDNDTLDEALKLGSETERDETDLGKYGMGLCTASLALGRRVEVLTLADGGPCLISWQDVDLIEEENDFVKHLGVADTAHAESIKDHGTIVTITKLDKLTNANSPTMKGRLRRELGRMFRYFLISGRSITVNGEKIEIEDPLWLNNAQTHVYSDETYDVLGDKVRVRIALLPPMSIEAMEENHLNVRTQGFSILRNQREIASGQTFDMWRRHGELNRMRGEIFFPASMDELMGVNFAKQGVNLSQAMFDALQKIIAPQVESIRKLTRKMLSTDPADRVKHEDAQKIISSKAKLLITPPVAKERRASPTNPDGSKRQQPTDPKRTRKPGSNHQPARALNCEFEEAHYGTSGPIFEPDQRGKTTVVTYNVDHPFYERFIREYRDEKHVLTGVDFLIYALATAELNVTRDSNQELVTNMKSIMSANLRTLLT